MKVLDIISILLALTYLEYYTKMDDHDLFDISKINLGLFET